jgi:hypothetical protein
MPQGSAARKREFGLRRCRGERSAPSSALLKGNLLNHAKMLCLAFLAALLGFSASLAPAASPDSSKQVMAYYETSGSYEALTNFYSYMNQMPTDTFGIDIHGKVSRTPPSQALRFAKAKGMLTFAAVSNFDAIGFDPKITHSILNQPKTRTRDPPDAETGRALGLYRDQYRLESIDHAVGVSRRRHPVDRAHVVRAAGARPDQVSTAGLQQRERRTGIGWAESIWTDREECGELPGRGNLEDQVVVS